MARPKKLTLDFYLHDANASSDPKIRVLDKRHGNDGYATFFRLLERLCQADGMQLSLQDTLVIEVMAEDFRLRDGHQLLTIIQTCTDLGLLDRQMWESERVVFSQRLYRHYQFQLEERHSAALRIANSRGYGKLRQKVYARDGFKCVYCQSENNLTIDHRIPVSRGGTDALDNLVTCCSFCNESIGDRLVEEWRSEL